MSANMGSSLVIDAHVHLGDGLRAEELLEMMDETGVHKAVVFVTPFRWSLPDKDNYFNTNDYIAEAQQNCPDRLIGFACVNPHSHRAVAELHRCIDKLGLRGLKLHPENHCFTLDSLIGSEFMDTLQTLQRETGRKLPVLSHGMTTMGCTPDQFASLARRYPDVPIIMGHGAGFQNLYFPSIRPVKELHNLFADTAMTTVDDSRLIEVTRIVGAEKVIFGSDHWSREQKNLYGNFFFVLERAFPDPEQRRLILGGNIAKVLGLQG
jgi:hypothetical protein